MLKWIVLSWSLWSPLFLLAQTAVNKQARFRDGVYASMQDFRQNAPSYKLGQIPYFSYTLDNEENILFLSNEATAAFPDSTLGSLDSIWGLCVKGVPYIKVEPEIKQKGHDAYFVRLYVVGAISYFYYKTFVNKEVSMGIYNPITGTKVAEKVVLNKEKVLVKKVLNFETGEIDVFEEETLKDWFANDAQLIKSLEKLPRQEREEKLFKTLLIYNDRNTVYFYEK